jgi:hypothetical protein
MSFNNIVAIDFTVDGEDSANILYVRIMHEKQITESGFLQDFENARKQFQSERDSGIVNDEELLNILSEDFGYSCEVICPDIEIKV